MYRVAFSVERRVISRVLDFLAEIKSYNVEWKGGGGLRTVSFLFDGRNAADVIDFISEARAHDVSWPVPAKQVSTAPITELIDLRGKKVITTADLRAALEEAGRSPGSTSYLAQQLRQAGKIKSGNTNGEYEVIRSPKKKAKKQSAKKVANKGAKE